MDSTYIILNTEDSAANMFVQMYFLFASSILLLALSPSTSAPSGSAFLKVTATILD